MTTSYRSNIIDMTKFQLSADSKLAVLRYAGRKTVGSQTRSMWLCKCECGAEVAVDGSRLRNGDSKTCGSKNCHIYGRNIWTEDMDKLLGTMPDTDLAKKFGMANKTIMNRRNKLGIPAYKIRKVAANPKFPNDERVKDILKMRDKGKSLREIGVKYGISRARVGQIIRGD